MRESIDEMNNTLFAAIAEYKKEHDTRGLFIGSYRKEKWYQSGFQLSVESNSRVSLVLLYFALWLVKKCRATLSTNQK